MHSVLKEIAKIFSSNKKQIYLVGGAVRDFLRKQKLKDYDLATDALPEEIIAMFRNSSPRAHVIPTGIKHGTVTVIFKGIQFEITTFRSESGYSDGRHPDKIEFGVSLEEDLSRRDFTMNAIAMEIPSGRIIDPFDGTADIKAGIIRCAGAAKDRFSEDGLRPIRGIRFAGQLGFSLDETVLAAIASSLPVISKISPERIRDEIDKIILSSRPSLSLLLMEKTGIMNLLLPELSACRNIEQKGGHIFDVLDHSLAACDFAAGENYSKELRMAALLHDTGKRTVRRLDENGIWTFYRHEKESSADAANIMNRLRYPNKLRDQVCHLIEEHMFFYEDNWTDAAVRRFIIKAGEENLSNLYRLRRADAYGKNRKIPAAGFLLPFQERIEKILADQRAFSLKDLAVNGGDLTKAGIKPGKEMGIILNELFETVVEDPDLNTHEKLLEIALKINKRYTKMRF